MLLLANTLNSEHREADSDKLLRDAYEIQKRKLGPDHPDTMLAMGNLAANLKDEKKYAESKAMLEELLPLQKKVLGDEHFLTLSTRVSLAELLSAQGDYADAEKSFRETRKLDEKVLGPDHPQTIEHLEEFGVVLAHERKDKEADQIFNEALHRAEKSKIATALPGAWYGLATGAAIEGNRAVALDRLKKAFEDGFTDVEGVRNDDDWKAFRGDPRFEAILNRAAKH
jgi:tetratricopeptide (TPR) repeat protein